VVGLQCGLGFAKLFFWEFGFGKTETEFSRPQEGSGEECGRDSGDRIFDRLTVIPPRGYTYFI
jgi:hypothetical protein